VVKTNAKAYVHGGVLAPSVKGVVYFDDVQGGTMVTAHIEGLPEFKRNGMEIGPHGFHIHLDGNCEVGTAQDPFPKTGGHYNPTNEPHGILYFRVYILGIEKVLFKKVYNTFILYFY